MTACEVVSVEIRNQFRHFIQCRVKHQFKDFDVVIIVDVTICISMLTVAGVSDKVIKKIVGHKGQGVTEVVYTHFEIEELIDAINKI